jgi:hypothetical protein
MDDGDLIKETLLNCAPKVNKLHFLILPAFSERTMAEIVLSVDVNFHNAVHSLTHTL